MKPFFIEGLLFYQKCSDLFSYIPKGRTIWGRTGVELAPYPLIYNTFKRTQTFQPKNST